MFGSPKGHPKVKPFIDHVLSFFIADGRIWFRNYQIVYEATDDAKGVQKEPVLVEIGPRFVLNPIKIFDGSFGGVTLWENPNYVSPQLLRTSMGAKRSARYQDRILAKKQRREHVATTKGAAVEDELSEVFETANGEGETDAEREQRTAAADTNLSKYAKTAVQKKAVETAELANEVLRAQAAEDDDGDVNM